MKKELPTLQSLIEQCKQKYPVGTKIMSTLRSEDVIGNDHIYTDKYFEGDDTGFIYMQGESGSRRVYEDGRWAEILQLPNTVINNNYLIY